MIMISCIKNILVLIIVLACTTLPAFAQQKDIEVTLDNTEIPLSSSIRMDMVFDGAEDMPAPAIPDVNGLKISYLRSTDAVSGLMER